MTQGFSSKLTHTILLAGCLALVGCVNGPRNNQKLSSFDNPVSFNVFFPVDGSMETHAKVGSSWVTMTTTFTKGGPYKDVDDVDWWMYGAKATVPHAAQVSIVEGGKRYNRAYLRAAVTGSGGTPLYPLGLEYGDTCALEKVNTEGGMAAVVDCGGSSQIRVLSACGQSGQDCCATGTACDAGSCVSGKCVGGTLAASYEAALDVLQTRCSGCHGGSFLSGTPNQIHSQLVNAPSSHPSKPYITPNNTSQSYIWEKITDSTPFAGSQMPLGQPPLPATERDAIEDWINAGAPLN